MGPYSYLADQHYGTVLTKPGSALALPATATASEAARPSVREQHVESSVFLRSRAPRQGQCVLVFASSVSLDV